MVQTMQNGTYANLYGVPVGEPLRSPFNPAKHLESNSFNAVLPREHQWLGIINTIYNFKKVKMPFLSMTELQKNTLEVDGPGSILTFAIPFKTGCPYLLESLAGDNPTPGKYGQVFEIVLSTNDYTYGDILTADYRNGKQIRIQSIKDHGYQAEIKEWGNGYKYLVALDGYDDEDYFPQEFLEEGTIFVKIDNLDAGEFDSRFTAVGSEPREELQMYSYTVGNSDRAIQGWVTSDASYKKYNLETPGIPALAHLNGASTDVLNYFFKGKDGKTKGLYWVPDFIEKMAAELAKMQERALLWQQGTVFIANGREKIRTGLGYYQQVKQRGNYDTYNNFDQLMNLVINFGERLFSIHNNVSPEDRVVKLRAGRLAYKELMKRFKQYFNTDNPFTVMADHPALLKAKMITYSEETGILYRPLDFKAIHFPDQGMLMIEHDPTLDNLDDYLEHPKAAADGSLTAGMVIIEDVSSPEFTNAIPSSLRQEGKSYKNVTLIKHKGKEDAINYRVGGRVSTQLKKMLGIDNGGVVADWNKTLEIAMWTHGEVFVQDPSLCWIIEYDPTGDIAYNNRNLSLFKSF